MTRRVLMLGLDAADRGVVLQLIAQGELPNLGRLFEAGVSGPLRSPAVHYAGGVWPSFYTGQTVPWHGVFHNKQWRPETMRVEVPGDEWIAARPFWETLSAAGVASCIVDVPMVLGAPRPIDGVTLAGWGTHDLIGKGAWPPELWSGLERRFGAPRMPREHFGRQSPRSLAQLQRQLSETTGQVRDLGKALLGSHAWQFACIVFGAIHRAGHYLFDLSQLDNHDGPDAASLRGALHDVYRQVDAAVGEVASEARGNTLVVAFSLHGMGPNPGWSDLFPDILASLEECATGSRHRRGLLYSAKQRLPHHWIRPILTRLPGAVADRLVPLWSRRMFDWPRTPYFPMPMDEAGYVRINLRGREQYGIVAAGAGYEALCQRLEARIAGLYDEATGEAIAGAVLRAWQEADPAATSRRLVPDLIVPWQGPTAGRTVRLRSRDFPGFAWDVPRRLPSGRSGNHTGNAWFVASGPGVPRRRLPDAHGVIDLLPTVFQYLGVPVGGHVQGRPIDLGIRE